MVCAPGPFGGLWACFPPCVRFALVLVFGLLGSLWWSLASWVALLLPFLARAPCTGTVARAGLDSLGISNAAGLAAVPHHSVSLHLQGPADIKGPSGLAEKLHSLGLKELSTV
jgi:hypothetical protein